MLYWCNAIVYVKLYEGQSFELICIKIHIETHSFTFICAIIVKIFKLLFVRVLLIQNAFGKTRDISNIRKWYGVHYVPVIG